MAQFKPQGDRCARAECRHRRDAHVPHGFRLGRYERLLCYGRKRFHRFKKEK